ncbi:MAG: acyltransferase [Bacteroidales bacterium]|jgi:maltose O-acetyltransferase|nr:acyltransferase [Bacteroidales bacterium]
MVYANNTDIKQVSLFTKVKVKTGKIIAKRCPYNKLRLWGVRLCGFKVGKQVYIGEDLIIASIISEKSCHLFIEDRVAIGPRVTLVLSSDANWSRLTRIINPIKGSITLEQDCWLGAGVIIMPNITIGKGAIVGSGAVVTKNVPAYTVVAGVPAKIIKKLEIVEE